MSADWIETKYRCLQCGAEDTDMNPTNRTPSLVANCAACGAGYGKEVAEMLARNIGMRVVVEEESREANQIPS